MLVEIYVLAVQHKNVLSGSGTTNLSINGSFTIWRATLVYSDYYGRQLSSSPSGVSGGSATLTVSEANKCNSTLATVSMSIAIKSAVSFSGTSGQDKVNYGCKNSSDVHISGTKIAQIKNAKITKLEVYRP